MSWHLVLRLQTALPAHTSQHRNPNRQINTSFFFKPSYHPEKPDQPPKMVTLPNHQTPIDGADLTTLKTDLTTPTHPTQRICSLVSIQTRLNDTELSNASLRSLFGHIRRAFIEVLWQQRQLERWSFRNRHLGSEYSQTQSSDSLSVDGRNLDRHNFARWMDEELEIRSGEKQELVTMVIRHVRLFRESELRVRELKEEKERVLASEGA
jgi:hypothetical protein